MVGRIFFNLMASDGLYFLITYLITRLFSRVYYLLLYNTKQKDQKKGPQCPAVTLSRVAGYDSLDLPTDMW